MIGSIFIHYHIRFQKEHRMSILLKLVYYNLFVEKIWKIRKQIRGIDRPIVHVYAVCWNEEKIIPFFLNYYNKFVDHFYIYDNYSEDKTDQILWDYPNLTVRKYDTGGTFNDVVHQQIKNNVWKQSRGKADWVIVIDMDEFIYYPELISKLGDTRNLVTIYKPKGYDMVSTVFPEVSKPIVETIKSGVESVWLDKSVLFNPNKIVEINYLPGAHECNPEGIVKFEEYTLKLLHYKYLGLDYVMSRVFLYRKRLSKENIEMDYGTHYFEEDEKIKNKFYQYLTEAKDVVLN